MKNKISIEDAHGYVRKFNKTCEDNKTTGASWFFNAQLAFSNYEEVIADLKKQVNVLKRKNVKKSLNRKHLIFIH